MRQHFISLLFILLFLGISSTADAQFLKRLGRKVERKIERKIDRKIDKEIDETLDGKNTEQSDTPSTATEEMPLSNSSGIATIRHDKTYGAVTIEEMSTPTVERNNEGYHINAAWRSHEVDVFDGISIKIKTDKNIRHDETKKERRFIFKIPEEATLTLGYDPQMPYNKKSDDDFRRGITDDYQNYDLLKGEVAIDVLDSEHIQVSFTGDMELRQVERTSNRSDDYSESFYAASLTGAIDAARPKFINNTTITKDTEDEDRAVTSWDDMEPAQQNGSATPGIYTFTFQTDMRVTVPDQDRTHHMSYLLNPEADYIAIRADMSDYDAEMKGESIIVVDGDDSHIFVETEGMKMRLSQSMMQGQDMQNPSEQMANYDYSKLEKTGNTKEILGAKCYEYKMSDVETQIVFWVAPDIQLPNWFLQSQELIDGHIMEYTVVSKEGEMTSTVTAIHDNISRTINPKDYKKMF